MTFSESLSPVLPCGPPVLCKTCVRAVAEKEKIIEINKENIISGKICFFYRRFDGVSGPVALHVADGDFQPQLHVVVGVHFPKRQSGSAGRSLGKV